MRFASSTRLSTWVGRRGAPTLLALTPLFVGCGLSGDHSPPDPRRRDGAVLIDGGPLDSDTLDGSLDGSVDDGGVDAWMPPDAGSCAETSECEARERSGAPTECEAWACVEGRCVENDYDGDGVGPGCEEPLDCDDLDPEITLEGVVACPAELSRLGICGATAYRTCTGGVLAATCEGFLPPLDAEVCNADDDDCDGRVDESVPESTFGEGGCAETLSCVGGDLVVTSPALPVTDGCAAASREVDDDCDGRIDEDCVPDECVYVRDGAEGGTGSAVAPFGRLSDAITAAEDRGGDRVCLLASALMGGCDALAYTMPTATISSDLTILGGLRADAMGTVTRCPTGAEATILTPPNVNGIRVPGGLNLTLRDLVVRHPNTGGGGVTAHALDVQTGGRLVMHGVRVRGSGAGVAATRRGVRVQNGGTLVAHASRIEAGPATTAYAIDAEDATVALLEGCGARGCTPSCADLNHGLATNRPGAALRMAGGELTVDRVAVCADGASTGVEISGTAQATIVRSHVEMDTDLAATVLRGVHASACTSLWVHESRVSTTVGGSDDIDAVVGVDVTSCPALLTDDTVDGVRANLGRRVTEAYGIRCTTTACTITGSTAMGASSGTGILEAWGLSCAGCSYVAQNTFVGAQVPTQQATGMWLESTRVVTRNRAVGGCGELVVGAIVLGGDARFTNNEAVGRRCDEGSPTNAAGLSVEGRAGASFVSHGNSYDAGELPSPGACNSTGVQLNADAPFGSFQNDVLVSGNCNFARAMTIQNRPPLSFTHGGLVGSYFEVVSDRTITSAADLVGAYPLFVGHVFTDTPHFVERPASLRIQPTSPFAGSGSRLGGPRVDLEGTLRPTPPSIGAWEP